MRRWTAAALGALLAACGGRESDPAPEPAPPVVEEIVADPDPGAMDYAAMFECEGGGELAVAFHQGAESYAMVSVGGAAPIMLPALPSDFEMAWGDGVRRLTFDGGSASYDAGGGAALLVCRAVDRGLPPPAAPNVVRQLGADDDGATVELKIGERFSVALSGVPTAGYLWAVENPPPFLRLAEELGGATSSSQFLPGFTGGNHWSVLVIEATAAGEGDLKLAQRRPWEDVSEPDAGAFTVRVKATN